MPLGKCLVKKKKSTKREPISATEAEKSAYRYPKKCNGRGGLGIKPPYVTYETCGLISQ